MTEEDAAKGMDMTAEALRKVTELIGVMRGPYEAAGGLFVIIANCIGNISSDNWRLMMQSASEPCDLKGCNCHVVRGEFFKALDKVRQDHRKHAPAETRMRGQRN